MENKEVVAYRGYYVNMDNIIPILKQLLVDAETRKTKVILVGGENIKLDGAIMSIMALKEVLYNLEVYGDLVPLSDPIKEVSNAAAHKAVEDSKNLPIITEDSKTDLPK